MQNQKKITFSILIIISIALYFVFANTKASPIAFLTGAFICLIIQAILLCIFCFYKLQQTYQQSKTLNLRANDNLDVEELYKFQKIQGKEQFYFNKYTDQARYFKQKDQMKTMDHNKDQYYFQEIQIDQPKEQTMEFLKQIRSYYNSLNTFSDVLVNFGQGLQYIQKGSVFQFQKFQFAQFEKFYAPDIAINELQQRQSLIFQETKTKLLKTKGQEKKLLFPNWATIIQNLKYIGNQFHKIETMRKSNSEMLTMIHHKVLQDFSLLQKKLIKIGKQLNKTIKELKDLQKDKLKYQNMQFNVQNAQQPHLEMMQWFKKQFYKLRFIQGRYLQNEAELKEKTSHRKYLQQKISTFQEQNKKTFMKTVKTCYIALLDSYHITVDESIKKIQQSFSYTYTPQQKKPKVKSPPLEKNINQALQAERQYQKQYFQRVRYYQNILDNLIMSLSSIGIFLNNLRTVFGEAIKSLRTFHLSKQKKGRYFTQLTRVLLQRSLTTFNEIQQLIKINEKVKQMNLPHLLYIKKQIKKPQQSCISLLSSLNTNQGPIQYKYYSTRNQLQGHYNQIQSKITHICQFQQIYLIHSGRIRKIIITQLIDFFNYQKKIIAIGNLKADINDNSRVDGIQLIQNLILNPLQNQVPQNNQLQIGGDNLTLQNGQLSLKYLKFANQFLFVCFTQWKNSNFFKHQIAQQLFIALNKDTNQSFSKIQVSELEFLGLPPQLIWLKQLKTQQTSPLQQAFFDVNISIRGPIKFKARTIYKMISKISVQVQIQLLQFYSVMRLCFVPSYIGRGWFSFIGQPIAKFKIVPKIMNYRIDTTAFAGLFNKFLMDSLRKNMYPAKQKILIPASTKDQLLQTIEKRFRALSEINN